jgi:hypothetical protein
VDSDWKPPFMIIVLPMWCTPKWSFTVTSKLRWPSPITSPS